MDKPTVRIPLQLRGSAPAVTTSTDLMVSRRLQVGECVEMDGGTEHEATVGEAGCIFVVGHAS